MFAVYPRLLARPSLHPAFVFCCFGPRSTLFWLTAVRHPPWPRTALVDPEEGGESDEVSFFNKIESIFFNLNPLNTWLLHGLLICSLIKHNLSRFRFSFAIDWIFALQKLFNLHIFNLHIWSCVPLILYHIFQKNLDVQCAIYCKKRKRDNVIFC